MVDDLTGQHVLHQGVEGEIPPAGGRFRADEGINENIKIPMALTPHLFLAGHGDVQPVAFQVEHTEAFTDGDPLAEGIENFFQAIGGDAVDFNVDVLARFAQKRVPDKAAHVVGAAAVLAHQKRKTLGHLNICGHGSTPYFYFNIVSEKTTKSKGGYHFGIVMVRTIWFSVSRRSDTAEMPAC